MTLAELRAAAAQEAGIATSGEPLDAADDQLVTQKYSALYDMLLTNGLVAWAATDDVPTYADVPLTMMLAAFIAPSFGVSGQRLAELRIAGTIGMSPQSLAESMLRRQLMKNYVSYPATSDYF